MVGYFSGALALFRSTNRVRTDPDRSDRPKATRRDPGDEHHRPTALDSAIVEETVTPYGSFDPDLALQRWF